MENLSYLIVEIAKLYSSGYRMFSRRFLVEKFGEEAVREAINQGLLYVSKRGYLIPTSKMRRKMLKVGAVAHS